MSWIRTIPEGEATGELAELYRRTGNPDGTVDNVMKIHALNPESLLAHFELYRQAMHRRSPLSRAERELVATVVSLLNGCRYCEHHHAQGLSRLLPEERRPMVERLCAGEEAELSEREAALAEYASKLPLSPEAMTEQDVARLRAAGLDDRAILDLVQCVGYFNYVNRIVTGLGVTLGEGEGTAGQWPTPA